MHNYPLKNPDMKFVNFNKDAEITLGIDYIGNKPNEVLKHLRKIQTIGTNQRNYFLKQLSKPDSLDQYGLNDLPDKVEEYIEYIDQDTYYMNIDPKNTSNILMLQHLDKFENGSPNFRSSIKIEFISKYRFRRR